jgi:NAD(P)-dependent dehydrogenase (short-subunit alcohol dehydrogenase family)
MTIITRRRAIITGASGGMGRALARRFGATMDLVLTDVAADQLRKLSDDLRDEGYTVVASLPGDVGEAALLTEIATQAAGGAGLGALIHAAGLSPQLADWDRIIKVNLVATEKLLQAIEPVLVPGSVAVLIASMAGHLMPPNVEIDTLFADPLDPTLIDRLQPKITGMAPDPFGASAIAYSLSKRHVMLLCEQHAAAWGEKGARIVSISPGLVKTPMGRREAEDPGTASMIDLAPVKRWGTVSDIVEAAWFLASDLASYISGCDLRIDGGTTAAIRTQSTTRTPLAELVDPPIRKV